MSCAIKNAKGLSGKTNMELAASFEWIEALKKGAKAKFSGEDLEALIAFAEALKKLPIVKMAGSKGNSSWSVEKKNWAAFVWVTGWVNESQPQEWETKELEIMLDALGELAQLKEKAQGLIAKLPGLDKQWQNLDALPSIAQVKKAKEWKIEEAGAGVNAKNGFAWAIWMGAQGAEGYMDGRKEPAGAAGARLFESAAGALRTAKAAKFGGNRGPAAIVKLAVELISVGTAHNTEANEIKGQLAKNEADEIEAALDAADLDGILGAIEGKDALAQQNHGLAGMGEGWALWCSHGKEAGAGCSGGFVNQRGDFGPLAGATLNEDNPHVNGGWAQAWAECRVRVRPVKIEELIGAPKIKDLQAAIDEEAKRLDAQALAKAGSGLLSEKAQALKTGAAVPKPRRI